MDDQPELIPTRPIEKELSKQFAIAHDLGTKNLALQAEVRRLQDLCVEYLNASTLIELITNQNRALETIIAQRDAEIERLNADVNAELRLRQHFQQEVARLTPQATRELPTKAGDFLFQPIGTYPRRIVKIMERHERLEAFWEAQGRWLPLSELMPGWWSREPIAPMVIPESEVASERR